MGQYQFEAKSLSGQTVRGMIDGANDAEVRVKLRAQKLIPVKIVSRGASRSSTNKVKTKDLQIFTKQLSTLLNAGIPIVQSIETLARSVSGAGLANTLNRVVEDLSSGKRLGDAFAGHPRVFDNFYVNMVKAGEEGGVLDTILIRLSDYIEKSVKLTAKIRSAMVYPSMIIFVSFGVIAVIMTFVIPKFQEMFSGMGQDLPALTQHVIAISKFFVAYWYLIIGGIVGGIFGLIQFYRTPNGKIAIDNVLIQIPLIGAVIQKGAISRFCRTLSTLLGAGVGIMESMDIAARTVGNKNLEDAFLRAKEAMSQGKSMTVTLTREKYIPAMVTQMIGVGEQTGALDNMLAKVADFYDQEVDSAVGALTSAMEPILMIVLGGIVGTLVIAMYLPIFKLASVVGG